MANPADLRAVLEAYGIGVRAGAITPCLQDENDFRKLMGLQPAPQEVVKDWGDSHGVRRPITLQRPSGSEELPDGAKDELGNILIDGEPQAPEAIGEKDDAEQE